VVEGSHIDNVRPAGKCLFRLYRNRDLEGLGNWFLFCFIIGPIVVILLSFFCICNLILLCYVALKSREVKVCA
jgi:hypothetical protein